ncbi:MAG: hypothetical protein ACHP85_17345, partial [Burkholderiales bacterium]
MRQPSLPHAALLLALAASLAASAARAQDYDKLIRDARVVDGSGAPCFRADDGLRGVTIAAVAPLPST